jgi:hypothetical protein
MPNSTDNRVKHHNAEPSAAGTARHKAAADKADRAWDKDNEQADLTAQQDKRGQEAAAAQDDSKTIAREKDTSRTAALRRQ